MASVKMLTPNKNAGSATWRPRSVADYRCGESSRSIPLADDALTAGPGKLYLINPLRVSLAKGAKEAMKRYLPVLSALLLCASIVDAEAKRDIIYLKPGVFNSGVALGILLNLGLMGFFLSNSMPLVLYSAARNVWLILLAVATVVLLFNLVQNGYARHAKLAIGRKPASEIEFRRISWKARNRDSLNTPLGKCLAQPS